MVLLPALILAFTYTACQEDRGSKASFFIITVPATWIPLCMLLMTVVIAGWEAAKVQGTGLVAAHLFDFLTNIYPTFGGGRNPLQTPAFLERFFAVTVPQVIQRSYGTAIRPPTATAASTGASSGGVLPESWRNRGSGHRLGGD